MKRQGGGAIEKNGKWCQGKKPKGSVKKKTFGIKDEKIKMWLNVI